MSINWEQLQHNWKERLTERYMVRIISRHSLHHTNEAVRNWARRWLSGEDRTWESAFKIVGLVETWSPNEVRLMQYAKQGDLGCLFADACFYERWENKEIAPLS